jgi:hypothetical protein
MIIALQKKKENIAEYLLYMWQVEDLLRACDLDEDRIDQLLVSRFNDIVPLEQIPSIRQWYLELRDMMLSEGKRQSGHLQINVNVIADMTELHLRLLKEGQDAIYTSCFYSTLPYIVELRGREGENKLGELETCFTALYGLMILNMQKREISEQTKVAMQQISKFIALLADKYKAWKNGELDFDED